MPTTTENTTIQDLQRQLAQAKQREHELAVEASELPGRIAEAAREDVKAKARQARETGEVAMATLASEVPSLEERMGTIRYEIWAAKVHRAELEREIHEAEVSVAAKQIPAAQRDLDRANRHLDDARRAQVAAAYALSGAERRHEEARRLLRAAEAEIGELEAEFPDA